MKLSAVVLTKNEEKNIKECLESLQWCDEIVVIDDYSNDKTIEIAKKFGAKVYQRHLNDNFADQRNFGLEKAKGSWVLFVDADERVSKKLRDEILRLISSQNFAIAEKCDGYYGYYLKRRDFFGGRWLKYGETANVELLRLARKNSGKWVRKVHETWSVKKRVGKLNNPLLHYPHLAMSDFLNEVNFYSTLHADALHVQGVKPSLFRLMANPLGKFCQNYFLRLGFLDGMPGLVVALMMSFHSFLARAKLYTRKTRNGETRKDAK